MPKEVWNIHVFLKSVQFTATCAVTALLFSTPVHAYLDPGSGSLAFQAITASVLGMLYAAKKWRRKIHFTMKKIRGNEEDGES